MTSRSSNLVCLIHGAAMKRASCQSCNAAYMRSYLRGRRLQKPTYPLVERARSRALKANLPFNLRRQSIVIPVSCPVLGIPLKLGATRSANSASLDRIVPSLGYVEGNVRVISDRANRLKADLSLEELRERARTCPERLRPEYQQIVAYLERELILAEVRERAQAASKALAEWESIAPFLDRLFACGLPQAVMADGLAPSSQ